MMSELWLLRFDIEQVAHRKLWRRWGAVSSPTKNLKAEVLCYSGSCSIAFSIAKHLRHGLPCWSSS